MNVKHILFVHYGDDWIRGSERCLIDLVSTLDKRQYQPYVWTNSPALHAEIKKLGVHSELSQFPILFGWKAPRYDFSGWRSLIRNAKDYIERADIDLVHVNSAAPCQWMCRAAKSMSIPLVTQLHSDYPTRDRITLGIHSSPHIIAVSDAVTDHLIEDGYPLERLSVIRNGLDIQRLAHQDSVPAKRTLDICNNSYLFATVGSLIHRKGIDRLLSALRHVTLEYPHAHLLIIGDGPLRKKLEQQAEALHLGQHVHFVGEQEHVLGWLKNCDCFISGAREEAFGLVVTEAALAGLPIIAPNQGGIPEIIEHMRTGILYKNTGIKPMVEAMRAVVKNRSAARAMGVRAKAHIQNHYTIEMNARNIESVYCKLLAGHGARSLSVWRSLRPLKTYLARQIHSSLPNSALSKESI
ncbi:glycosyltransferase family 4 protein [Vibrio sp. TRT 21S02]|uniref:glycosyltransferase family 4 protein n=1 Tax=Vibrio sp. TRT 21S02 TaxID=3418507 RepID=UPI003CF4EB08